MLYDLPDHFKINSPIVVRNDVSQSFYFLPFHIGMT